MRFFDVIFATRHFEKEETVALWREQEYGTAGYVTNAIDLEASYCKRVAQEASADLSVRLGFNITTSIGAMLPGLPRTFLATTCEFPAVLSQFQRSGCDLAAWICPFAREITWRRPAPPPASGHVVLLLSHVDYITGQDIVADVIGLLADSAPAQGLRFTVIVDGAHGIGNVGTIADVAKIRAAFEEHLEVEDFVYVFDHNKWMHGFPGLAVTLHTGVPAPSIEGIFPRAAEPAFAEFGEPVSVSFNPLLPQWTANFLGPAAHAFDRDLLAANRRLACAFGEQTAGRTFTGVEVFYSNTNMALLMTARPETLFSYLAQQGYRTHLMGSSRIRGSGPGGTGGVRLTFSALSLVPSDIGDLAEVLEGYCP